MAAKFGISKIYTDARELLTDPEVEMVDVCTPTDTHLPLSLAAIAAGKHVLSEKPLAHEAKDAFAAARAAREAGVRTKLGFTFRYSPAIRQLQSWIRDGTLGEIFHVHGLGAKLAVLRPDLPRCGKYPLELTIVRLSLHPSSGTAHTSLIYCAGARASSAVSSARCITTSRSGLCVVMKECSASR